MRIVIDLQGAQTESRFRGIGRYSLSLATAIVRNRGDHEILIILNGLFPHTIEPIRAAFDGLLPPENIRVWYAPGPVMECQHGNTWLREAAERIREAFLASLQPDVVFVTSLFEGFVDDAVTSIGVFDQRTPTAIILYDLIPLLDPDHYLLPNPAYEQYYLRKIEHLKRAYAWLAISNSSAKEGVEALGLRGDRLFIISSAVDERFKPIGILPEEKANLLRKYGISRPFLLYTGGIDPRKNIEGLIHAFARLPKDMRKVHQLVIVCSLRPESRRTLEYLARQVSLRHDELVLTGYVTDKELVKLYNLCRLFVLPSYHEGFGLPALEAMACGAPVIASNTSSLPEVVGREDALFDPCSEESISSKILEVLTNGGFRKELIRHGLEQAKMFSWEESAQRCIAVFEQIYAEQHQSAKTSSPPDSRPKLAYISPLPPERSGISDYGLELLPELARHYDIEVIVAKPKESDPWIRGHLPIRSVQYFTKNAGSYDRVLYHFGNSSFHQHMFDLLDRFPGVVVLHDFFLGNIHEHIDHIIPGDWSRELYNSHGYRAVWERFHLDDREEAVFKYPCNFSILQRALGLIVHSRYSVGLAKEWYGLGDDWSIIPQLLAPSKGVDRMAARSKLGIAKDSFLVCSFGILGPIKQNNRLLNAWINSSLAHDPRCQLIFVGENQGGDYGQELLDTIRISGLEDRVRITGWVDPDSLRNYLEAADIAVQLRTLSRGETSRAILDCMNHGMATIVNANGSLAELPEDAVYMLPDDFEDSELIESMEVLWKDIERRQNLGKRAHEVISIYHSPKICADMFAQSIETFYNRAKISRGALVDSLARLDDLPSNDRTLTSLAVSIAESLPLKFPARQILVDVSELVQRDVKTGIQRVTRSILKELLLNPPLGYRVEPVCAKADKPGYSYARKFVLRLLKCPAESLEDEPIEFRPGDIFLGLDLQPHLIPIQLRYLESLHCRGVRIFFVVYDLIAIQRPEVFLPGAEETIKMWLRSVARVTDGVICISRTVAVDLEEWLKTNGPERLHPLKIGWFHLGADLENSIPTRGLLDDAQQVLAQLSARTSILMIGTIEPRKGYAQTLAAFEHLWKNSVDVNLIIVGKEGWMVEKLSKTLRNHIELGRRLFWLEGISDEYLEKVYASCTCLIAASEDEGFGLPLIEAAQHKLPIIARDIPVFREVAGEHVYYFNGKEPSDLAMAVQEWLALFRSGQNPKSDDMTWLTWKQSTQQLLDIILEGRWYAEWIDDRNNQ